MAELATVVDGGSPPGRPPVDVAVGVDVLLLANATLRGPAS